jgi:Ca2+-binding RTX toxin-like protein
MLTGNGGNNILDGAGGDTLIGGASGDTYKVDSTTDAVIQLPGGGVDAEQSTAFLSPGANIENLALTGDNAGTPWAAIWATKSRAVRQRRSGF